jgi:hypothetical protein
MCRRFAGAARRRPTRIPSMRREHKECPAEAGQAGLSPSNLQAHRFVPFGFAFTAACLILPLLCPRKWVARNLPSRLRTIQVCPKD